MVRRHRLEICGAACRSQLNDKTCVRWCRGGVGGKTGHCDGWLDGLDGEMERRVDRDSGIRHEWRMGQGRHRLKEKPRGRPHSGICPKTRGGGLTSKWSCQSDRESLPGPSITKAGSRACPVCRKPFSCWRLGHLLILRSGSCPPLRRICKTGC